MTNNNGACTNLENSIVNLIIHQDAAQLSEHDRDVLWRQFLAANVSSREFSGAGFFTTFEVSSVFDRALAAPTHINLMGHEVILPELKYGAGFTLFIKNGVIEWLEGYSFQEDWPSNTDIFTIVPES